MPETATLSSAETIALFQKYVVPNYGRFPVSLVRGEGSYVWDAEGNRYLDFFPGWGCNLLGHCPPTVVEAVQEQIATLIHVPNTWYTPWQGQWAQALSDRSFGGQAFFCNSGTEANEAAIKLARLHTPKERYKIITFTGGFHGRTLGATSATAQPKYHEGLGPLMAGFVYAPFGDLNAVKNLIDRETAAILIEPIQGEGGINMPPPDFLPGLRQLCDENNLLLMFDEVQTGCGRTGQWFAYQHFGVIPDVMTLAKALCGGVAGGALLTKPEIAPSLRPGMHAATFGGNPIAARAGLAYIEAVDNENLLDHAQQIERRFSQTPGANAQRMQSYPRRPHPRHDDRCRTHHQQRADCKTLPRTPPASQRHARHRAPVVARIEHFRRSNPRRLRHPRRRAETSYRGLKYFLTACDIPHSTLPIPHCSMRHLLCVTDLSSAEIERIFAITADLKSKYTQGVREAILPGRVIARLFEKQSLRTRVSFEAGMVQLGGGTMFLGSDVGFGARESMADFCASSANMSTVSCFAANRTNPLPNSPNTVLARSSTA